MIADLIFFLPMVLSLNPINRSDFCHSQYISYTYICPLDSSLYRTIGTFWLTTHSSSSASPPLDHTFMHYRYYN